MTVYVEALSLVNALGEDDAILANLAEGRAPGMEGPLAPSTGSRLRSAA